MKLKHLIIAAGFCFAVGCDTPSNMSGSAANANASTDPASSTTAASTSSTTGTNQGTTSNATTTTTGTNQGTTGTNQGTTGSETVSSGTTGSGNTPGMASTTTTNAGAVVVPPLAQTEFQKRYPTATGIEWSNYSATGVPIEWDLTDWPALDAGDYVVRYKVDDTPYYSWYDQSGSWIGSSSVVNDFTKLPAPIQTMLSTNYAGYKISNVHREDWKNTLGYEIEMTGDANKVKLLVDANGKILKQKTKAK